MITLPLMSFVVNLYQSGSVFASKNNSNGE